MLVLNMGLDFGTTTSILSYYDAQMLKTVQLGGASASPYIPSMVAIDKTEENISIGQAARLLQNDEDYHCYRYFKLFLAENDTNLLIKQGYITQTPLEIAQIFLQQLFAQFQQQLGGIPFLRNQLVITVPEIWLRSGQHAARENLQHLAENLGFKQVQLVSEPVAAGIYFAECYQQRLGKAFNGHILVCDYGGGTLDLSLSKLEGRHITVLQGTGTMGNEQQAHLGKAGVAFDEALLQRLVLKYPELMQHAWFSLLARLEEQKIIQTEKISKALERYRANSALNKKLFELEGCAVESVDFIQVFDEFIAPELKKALQQMAIYLKEQAINTEDSEHFHVVLVGGFSNFYLVRQMIRQFFNSKTEADSRFLNYFDLTDTALAISKGATLLANENFAVQVTCPVSLGIRIKNQLLQEIDITLLEMGHFIEDYFQPNYFKGKITVLSEAVLNTFALTLFIKTEQQTHYFSLQGHLRDIVPNPQIGNQWRVGFAMDKNVLFYLCVEDKSGEQKRTSLGKLQQLMTQFQYDTSS